MLRNPHDALWYGALSQDAVKAGTVADTALVRGEGCRVLDAAGRWYLDARSALWNASLGYGNRRITDAIAEQLRRLPVAQLIRYEQPPAIALEYARRLVSELPGELSHVRFGNTGSQAVECAVLLSRFVRTVSGDRDRTAVIAFDTGYHGTGGLANALTGEAPLHSLSGPLAADVHHVPPWDLAALRGLVDRLGPDRVSCLLLEPILGTDVLAAPPGYLVEARRLCGEHDIHLIVDEITTGFGRTGALTASEAVRPDLLVLSKGITSGYVPLSAVVVSQAVFDAALADPGLRFPHGSTSDGHPLAMAAGLAVLDELADGSILAGVRACGQWLTERLRELPLVHEVRGAGLMLGVELRADGHPLDAAAMAAVGRACAAAGLLITSGNNTIVLMPPLVITDEECDELVQRLGAALAEVAAGR